MGMGMDMDMEVAMEVKVVAEAAAMMATVIHMVMAMVMAIVMGMITDMGRLKTRFRSMRKILDWPMRISSLQKQIRMMPVVIQMMLILRSNQPIL